MSAGLLDDAALPAKAHGPVEYGRTVRKAGEHKCCLRSRQEPCPHGARFTHPTLRGARALPAAEEDVRPGALTMGHGICLGAALAGVESDCDLLT